MIDGEVAEFNAALAEAEVPGVIVPSGEAEREVAASAGAP
jgi:hypothetical protein